jgi:lipopolysaccharide export system permease protein
MKLYSRYIFLYLAKVFLLIVFTLTTIIVIVQFLTFINQYLKINLGLHNIITFILLQSTSIFYYVFPIALIATVLYVYYSLSIDSEIIVLETSGVSKYDISSPAIKFAIVITLISYLITMFVEPLSKRKLHNHKNTLINSSMISSILEEKSFNRITKDVTLYIDKQEKNNSFKGVAIYDKRGTEKEITIFAERAEILNKDEKIIFVLYNGSRQDTNQDSLRTLYFYNLSFPIEKIASNKQGNDSNESTILDLLFAKKRDLKSSVRLKKELNNKLSYPLLNLALSTIALAALFSGTHSRQWQKSKVKNAVLFSAITITTTLFFKANVASHFIFIILLYTNIFAVIYLSIYILKCRSKGKDTFFDNSISHLITKSS